MGRHDDNNESRLTEVDFQAGLCSLLEEAKSNDIPVQGRWQLTSNDSSDAWEFEIIDPSHRSVIRISDSNLMISSISEAIMTRKGVDIADLPPLSEAVNPDLLELLFDPTGDRPNQYLTFEYADYWVTACSDGSVVLKAGSPE